MKKIVIGAAVLLVLVVGGVMAYILAAKNSSNNSGAGSVASLKNNESPIVPVKACDVLTDAVVKEVVGSDVKQVSQPVNNANLPGSADNSITTCYYMNSPKATSDTTVTPKMNGATLLVYSAKTAAGGVSNKAQFLNSSQDTQKVDGIGDAAFYNTTFRQLNILKGNNWYVITNFKDTILNSTLDGDLALAKKLDLK